MTEESVSRSRGPRLGSGRGAQIVLVSGVLLIVAVVAVVVGINTFSDRRDQDPVAAGHVHALGVNPADGAIMVASHAGLLRVDPATSDYERVGGHYRDMMGFVVVGPDEFLASGHPDVPGMVEGDPGQLGMLRSADGGLTWQEQSLSGAADLHEIVVAGNSVLAWDSMSSQLMVSEDLQSWDALSSMELLDLVVDPDNHDQLVAATSTGVVRSVDGGRSWEPMDGPEMVQVAWSATMGRFGVDAEGVLWKARGLGWSRTGSVPGEPQVLEADGRDLLVAVWDSEGETEVYSSVDEGRTWSRVFRDSQGEASG